MAFQLDVFANVVDLRKDKPKPQDRFLVDTNVWYWLVYTRYHLGTNQPQSYQLQNYPPYIKKAANIKSSLHYCGLSFSEISHQIERIERDIYALSQNIAAKDIEKKLKIKDFRHNYVSTERPKVLQEIQAAWQQIEQFGRSLDLSINNTSLNNTLQRLIANPQENRLDAYDLFLVEAMFSSNVMNIITDDGDFLTVKGITVFTANRNAIKAAKTQGKLKTR